MVFDIDSISKWETEKNLEINSKDYRIIIGLMANTKEQLALAIIAKHGAEKPTNFITGQLPKDVYRLEHTTFEGLQPMIEKQLTELIR